MWAMSLGISLTLTNASYITDKEYSDIHPLRQIILSPPSSHITHNAY